MLPQYMTPTQSRSADAVTSLVCHRTRPPASSRQPRSKKKYSVLAPAARMNTSFQYRSR